eukprot:3457940-Pyramimonas_sp.AAC.1
MRPLQSKWGPFDCDLFTDRDGHLSLAALWYHPESSAFEASVLGNRVWAFPPKALAGQTLHFLRSKVRERVCKEAPLLLAEDPGAP